MKKPFYMLAPMYDVTDEAFRQMFVKYGKLGRSTGGGGPDVLFTEFVSVDGLLSPLGRKKLLRELYFQPNEHPIVAQVFGSDPVKFKEVAKLISELGFDGMDINMGCPDKAVVKQGAGSALIKNPDLAKAIIESAKEGAGEMPVSVKTRLGYSSVKEMDEWLSAIISAKPAMLTVHLRTMKELSQVPAHWELAEKITDMAKGTGVLISANGDIENIAEAKEKADKYNLDGVMIGRGAFGNPWFFANLAHTESGCQIERPVPNPGQSAGTDSPSFDARSACPSDPLGLGYIPTISEKLQALAEHLEIFSRLYLAGPENDKLFGGHTKNFAVMKKHYKAYVNGLSGATALRAELMEADTPAEASRIIWQQLKIIDK